MAFGRQVASRNWSEYAIEFVMLFLAVSLGFVAENIREEISENNKRREILTVVASDFEMDIEQLEFHKSFARQKLKEADSLRTISLMDPATIDQKSYYRLLLNIPVYWFFSSTDKARNDADAKGFFLSSHNKELARVIERFTFYYNDMKSIDGFMLRLNEKFLMEVIPGITEEAIFFKQWRYPNRPELPSKLGIKPLESASKRLFLNHIANINAVSDTYLTNYDSMQVYARKAVQLLKTEVKK